MQHKKHVTMSGVVFYSKIEEGKNRIHFWHIRSGNFTKGKNVTPTQEKICEVYEMTGCNDFLMNSILSSGRLIVNVAL